MRLRWNFHRLMLEQSMGSNQDEFAGRIATKGMQTALAVRDTWLIFTTSGLLVIYFTRWSRGGAFDAWLVVPFNGLAGLVHAGAVVLRARLGKVAQAQAMRGR